MFLTLDFHMLKDRASKGNSLELDLLLSSLYMPYPTLMGGNMSISQLENHLARSQMVLLKNQLDDDYIEHYCRVISAQLTVMGFAPDPDIIDYDERGPSSLFFYCFDPCYNSCPKMSCSYLLWQYLR